MKVPIPGQKHRAEAAAEEEPKVPKVKADLGGDGTKLPEAEVESKDKAARDFKITKRLLDKYGLSQGCPGCEASLEGKSRSHTQGCRNRIEEAMRDDFADQETLAKKNLRTPAKLKASSKEGESERTGDAVSGDQQEANASADRSQGHSKQNWCDEQIPEFPPEGDNDLNDEDDNMPELHESDSEDEKEEKHRKRETDVKADEDKEGAKRRKMANVSSRKFIYKVARTVRNRYGEGESLCVLKKMIKDLELKDTPKIANKQSSASGKEGEEMLRSLELNDPLKYAAKDKECHKPMLISQIMQTVMEMGKCSPHETEESEKRRWQAMYRDMEFYDDVKGAWLDKEEVVKARRLELEFFRNMGVYKKVAAAEARGHKIITTRWVDTNKGDDQGKDYRSRLVGRELKQDSRLDLFAPTPPLEVLKALISYCAKSQNGHRPRRLATVDIKRAYFYAPACRRLYIRLPEEDRMPGEEDMVGELQLSLYGTRDAAMNWTRQYTNHLVGLGFQRGKASACNFVHEGRNIRLTCHGDDFDIVAAEEDIRWLIKKMEEVYDLKSTVLGPEEHNQKELRILNRTVRWTTEGIEYEGDQRHAEVIIKELGMQDQKPLSTPGAPEIMVDVEKEAEVKDKEELHRKAREEGPDSLYCALAARINYMAQDRFDLTFASNWSSQFMSQPTPAGWKVIRRIGRYLLGTKRMIQTFHWGQIGNVVEGQGDSDWAGDRTTRKSTSGGVIRWNGDVLKGWATKQQTIALSSGEAELYAMSRTASQVIGMIQLLGDLFPQVMRGVVRTDSSAAIGIASRQGLGRTRHIQVQHLWMQEKIANQEISVQKIDGKHNISDILTKHLRREEIDKIMKAMCMKSLTSSSKNPKSDEAAKKVQRLEESRTKSSESDYWVRTEKRQWPGSELDKVNVEGSWAKISKEAHEELRKDVLRNSRWLRDHSEGRAGLFYPLSHNQGPSQAKHVPDVRVSSFKSSCEKGYDVFIDNWKSSETSVPSSLQKAPGWTAFVYQVPQSLLTGEKR